MNITELLLPQPNMDKSPDSTTTLNIIKPTPIELKDAPIHDDELMHLWELALEKSGFHMRTSNERNTLTDAILSPIAASNFVIEIPVHVKVIGRHMNGSFRCHIGTSKASRPICSTELSRQMRLLVVFFRTENAKSQLVSPDFIFFPTWLLHLFRYTQHGSTPGRTDVRFLENANMAKEDHIYRLNHVLNTLFRFNIRNFNPHKMKSAIELANFLFDNAGLDYRNLPRPIFSNEPYYLQQQGTQPAMYPALLLLLHSPRPTKFKPMCFNCNTKPASRRRLCVACYRYQLKHGEPRPLRLIVANRPGPSIQQQHHNHQQGEQQDMNKSNSGTSNLPMVFYSPKLNTSRSQKYCANCNVQETHQWYRNLCGHGHWCETCKSYYLRHTKVRPPELFVKAAKRKVDVRTLVNWNTWSWDDIPTEAVEAAAAAIMSNDDNTIYGYNNNYYYPSAGHVASHSNMSSPTTSISSSTSYPATPPLSSSTYFNHQKRRTSFYSSNSSSPMSLW